MPRLTVRQLNRSTLQRQMLLQRQPFDVVEGVRRLAALQAQSAASPYLALWNRLDPFDPADLDELFTAGGIVKSSLLRLTLHAVHADDYPVFHRAMVASLRASRLNDRRFTSSGLDAAAVDAAVPALVEFTSQARSSAAIEAQLADEFGAAAVWAWWALKMYGPFHRAPNGGAWAFDDRASFIAAPPSAHALAVPDQATATASLLYRYLAAYGPATANDFGQFTMLRKPAIDAALAVLGDSVVRLEGPDGVRLVDVADGVVASGDEPAPPRLLGMWDNMLLAYQHRSRVLPDAYRSAVIRRNGDVLASLLIDGYVAGVWRTVNGRVEVTAFQPLSKAQRSAVDDEAAKLTAFLATRDPAVYSRYARWWTDLPANP